jgi:hypothetical protein
MYEFWFKVGVTTPSNLNLEQATATKANIALADLAEKGAYAD